MSIFSRKCGLCGECHDLVVEITDGHIYAETYRYHEHCLDKIAAYPEAFTNRQVDWAIQIIDLKSVLETRAVKSRKEYKKKHKQLEEYSNNR
jgi:hypothetical protein